MYVCLFFISFWALKKTDVKKKTFCILNKNVELFFFFFASGRIILKVWLFFFMAESDVN